MRTQHHSSFPMYLEVCLFRNDEYQGGHEFTEQADYISWLVDLEEEARETGDEIQVIGSCHDFEVDDEFVTCECDDYNYVLNPDHRRVERTVYAEFPHQSINFEDPDFLAWRLDSMEARRG